MKQEKKNGKKEGAKENSVQIAKELLKIGMEVKQIIEITSQVTANQLILPLFPLRAAVRSQDFQA